MTDSFNLEEFQRRNENRIKELEKLENGKLDEDELDAFLRAQLTRAVVPDEPANTGGEALPAATRWALPVSV